MLVHRLHGNPVLRRHWVVESCMRWRLVFFYMRKHINARTYKTNDTNTKKYRCEITNATNKRYQCQKIQCQQVAIPKYINTRKYECQNIPISKHINAKTYKCDAMPNPKDTTTQSNKCYTNVINENNSNNNNAQKPLADI